MLLLSGGFTISSGTTTSSTIYRIRRLRLLGGTTSGECIVIVAGHDASWLDPLARMMVTMDGYRRMSTMMVDLAQELCAGRFVMLQAGGYSASYVLYFR